MKKYISFHTPVMVSLVTIINRLLNYFIGGKHRPVFFNIAREYPELLPIQANYEVIRKELESVLVYKNDVPRFHEIDPVQIFISGNQQGKDWRMFELYCYGFKPEKNRILCPNTCAILNEIPSIQHAVFSILDPGKSIPAHTGVYKGILRYHLALKVPSNNPPKIRVKDQEYQWQAGESILFDDTWNHEVYNDSDETRVVLFIDVKRRLPYFLDKLNSVLLKTLGSKYGQIVRKNLNWQR